MLWCSCILADVWMVFVVIVVEGVLKKCVVLCSTSSCTCCTCMTRRCDDEPCRCEFTLWPTDKLTTTTTTTQNNTQTRTWTQSGSETSSRPATLHSHITDEQWRTHTSQLTAQTKTATFLTSTNQHRARLWLFILQSGNFGSLMLHIFLYRWDLNCCYDAAPVSLLLTSYHGVVVSPQTCVSAPSWRARWPSICFTVSGRLGNTVLKFIF